MSWFKRLIGGVQEQYIARPQHATDFLIWRHPNQNIPKGSRLTVRSDERALFFKHGRLAGALHAGDYALDDGVIPFLDALFVRPLTGGDHFITELFFVREAEHIHEIRLRELGTFNDVASRLVVRVEFSARFAVRVEDGVALITTLAGQSEDASERVAQFLDSRIRSLVSAAVGQMLASMPVLQVVSNQHGEAVGQHIQNHAAHEFRQNGLVFSRFLDLELRLDDASMGALRDFGSAQAELNIQREGVALASQPGFANYHLVQGQRAALEGLGDGLATGRMGPVLGVGGGWAPPLGMPDLSTGFGAPGFPVAPTALRPIAPRPPGTLETTWNLRTEHGADGPYTAFQLATRLASEAGDVGAREVQAVGSGAWQRVQDLPELMQLVRRSAGPVVPTLPTPTPTVESRLREFAADGVLSQDEQRELLILLAREMPDADVPTLTEQLAMRARARGLRMEG